MNVIWGKKAKYSYFDELDFILKKWNQQEVDKFIILVNEFIKTLEEGVLKGKVSSRTDMRSYVISEQTTVFFDINEQTKTIELLLFWNNAKNPKTLKKLLKKV